jgi:hypothetical protein
MGDHLIRGKLRYYNQMRLVSYFASSKSKRLFSPLPELSSDSCKSMTAGLVTSNAMINLGFKVV